MPTDTRTLRFVLPFMALCFAICLLPEAKAQNPNLVINPSFELSTGGCHAGTVDSFLAVTFNPPLPVGWKNPNFSTPEIYHRCANSLPFVGTVVGVPTNLTGTQEPHTGDAYMGFIAQSGFPPLINDDGYREYLQGTLSQPLVPGKQYCVKMWAVAADGLSLISPGVGLRLTTDTIRRYDYNSFEMTPHIRFQGNALRDNVNWTLISGIITADSAYAYVTVGNVQARGQTPGLAGPGGNFGLTGNAYYHVDDVSVREVDSALLNLITVSNDTSICDGETVNLNVNGGDATTWNTGQAGSSITVSPIITTTYIATTEVDCISRRDTIVVYVRRFIPAPDFRICPGDTSTLLPPNVCGPPPYQYKWTALDSSFVGLTDSTQTVAPLITSQFEIIVTDSLGADYADTVIVFVRRELNVVAGPDTTICPQEPVTLQVLSADGCRLPYSYEWQTLQGSILGTDSTLAIAPDSTTQYIVTVTDAIGLIGSDTITVVVNRQFDVIALSNTVFCQPDTISLGVNIITCNRTPYTYAWRALDSSFTGSDSSITVSPDSTTQYVVTVTDARGLTGSDTVTVVILGRTPVADFAFTPGNQGAAPFTVRFADNSTGSNPATIRYFWQFTANAADTSNLRFPTFTYNTPGVYTVLYVMTNGQCSDSLTATITVTEPETGIHFIPNVFTPNGDGIHDTWTPRFQPAPQSLNLRIYDRWGVEVFSTTDASQNWSGLTSGGSALPDGVYFYNIRWRWVGETDDHTATGSVTLLR